HRQCGALEQPLLNVCFAHAATRNSLRMLRPECDARLTGIVGIVRAGDGHRAGSHRENAFGGDTFVIVDVMRSFGGDYCDSTGVLRKSELDVPWFTRARRLILTDA